MSRILTFEDIPRWFTLTIDQSTGFPCFKIYNDVLAKLPGPHLPQIIKIIRTKLNLSEDDFLFHEPAGEFFGFGNGLEKIGDNDGQTIYRINLPEIHKITDEACSECNGTKSGSRYDGGCPYCDSSGKKSVIDWTKARALSASTKLLSNLLWLAQETEREIVSEKFQLLTLTLVSERGQHGSSIGGEFSPHFVQRLRSFGEKCNFEKAEVAMIKVYYQMFPPKNPETKRMDCDMRFFEVEQKLSGNLIINVPGDRCCIHPSRGVLEIRPNEGYDWASHNVDTPLQQLTMLTGLAAVCDLIDIE